VLIRQFMKSFAITRFKAGLVQSAFYMGYFVLAMPAALLMRKAGYKTGFVIGLLLYGGGCFRFWPAALAGSYGYFLFALFVIASGLSFLETASNPFIAQLGDPHTSKRRLNFSQAFNPLGSISGALMGTVFIFSGIELTPQEVSAHKAQGLYEAHLRTETLRVIKPYLVLGAVAIFWAVLILRTKFPAIQSEHESSAEDHGHFKGASALPALSVGGRSAVSVCGCASGHLELLYPVRSGVHAPAGEGGWLLLNGHAGRVRSGKIRVRVSHAHHCTQQTDGSL